MNIENFREKLPVSASNFEDNLMIILTLLILIIGFYFSQQFI